MAFNVNEFISHFEAHDSYSKSAKFEVIILPPPGLSKLDTRGLTFQCETAELPGYNLNTIDGRVYGAVYSVAATPVFQDLSLTFICAGDLWEKQFFDGWLDFIMPKQQYGYRTPYREDYVTNLKIISYHESAQAPNAPRKSLEIDVIEAFPYTVAPISLNWASDEINRLQVTFKYARWEQKPGPQTPVGTARPLNPLQLANLKPSTGVPIVDTLKNSFGPKLGGIAGGAIGGLLGGSVNLPKVSLPGGSPIPLPSINLPKVSFPTNVNIPLPSVNLPKVSLPGGAPIPLPSVNLPKVSLPGGISIGVGTNPDVPSTTPGGAPVINVGLDLPKSSIGGAATTVASTVQNILKRRPFGG